MINKIKVNSLNPFDKAFFGKTMESRARDLRNRGEFLNPTILKSDCVDELNHFFLNKMIARTLEKAPDVDTFAKLNSGTDVPSFMKNAIK